MCTQHKLDWGVDNAATVAGAVLPLIAGIISGWCLLREPRYGALGPVPRAIFAVIAALGLFQLMSFSGMMAQEALNPSSRLRVMAVRGSLSHVVLALEIGMVFSLYVWTQQRIQGAATKVAARITAGCFVLLAAYFMAPWLVVASAKLAALQTTPTNSSLTKNIESRDGRKVPKTPAKPSASTANPKSEKQANEVPFKGAPRLRYIAWMPKDESGWQLHTPEGEAVTAPGDIPVDDWEGWREGLLGNAAASKISGTSGWLMFFYSHPAIDERSEGRLSLFTPAGAEIKVTQRVFGAHEPKTPQADAWLATGCRVPYAAVQDSLKVRLALTAGSWWSSELVAAGKTNNSAGGQFLTNSGEDSNHRAFVTVVTEDEDKVPYYQWEVLGRLRDGSDVRSEGSTTVNFQSQYVHTISFGRPLATYAGFIIRSRERKNFINDGVHVPQVLVANPESASKSTFQMRWIHHTSSAETEPMKLAGRGQNQTLNVEKTVLLDKSALESAKAIHMSGGSLIELQFTASGRQRFAELTREGKGRRLAIVIDGKVHAAPMILGEITDGRVEISGNLTHEEADDLAARLQQTIESTSALKSSNDQAETNAQRQMPAASTADFIFGPAKGHVLSSAADGVAPYFQFAGGKIFMIRQAPTASVEEIKEDWEKADAAGGVDFSVSGEAGGILIQPRGCAFGEWITDFPYPYWLPASHVAARADKLTAKNESIRIVQGQWPVYCVFRTSRGVVGLMTVNSVHLADGKPVRLNFEYKRVTRRVGAPQTVQEFFQKATSLWDQGDYEGVVRVYDEAVKHHPGECGYFNNRANAHAALGHFDQALADYAEALRLRPGNDNIHRARSVAYYLMGDYDRAIADLDIAVKASPEGVNFDLRGRAYHAKGDFRAALADYEKGVQMTPGYTLTFLDLAWLLATCPDDTIRDGQKASQYADLAAGVMLNRRPEVSVALAAAHAEQRDYAEAIRLEQEYLKARPSDSPETQQSRERLKLYQAHKPFRSPQPISRGMWR